jgi:hypothetical protein
MTGGGLMVLVFGAVFLFFVGLFGLLGQVDKKLKEDDDVQA